MSATHTLNNASSGLLLNSQGGGITAGSQGGAAAVALDAGRFAAAWVSNGSGTTETIQFGIFNATTRALIPASITDLSVGPANFSSPRIALLSDGNVALAWAQHAPGTTTYWTAVLNGTTGAVVTAPTVIASASIPVGAVSIAARADGYVVAYSGDATPANSPAFVTGFTNSGAVDTNFTTFNAMQRNYGVSELSVSVLTNGTIFVIAEGYEGPPGSGLERGGNVGFRIWNPDGTPVLNNGQPVFGDVIGAYVDSRIVSAALPNGNVAYAFDQGNLSNNSNILVMGVRGPQGQYVGGGDTFVLSAEDQLLPSIAVLGDGGFAVSWSRRLLSDGSPTGTIITTFLPDGTRASGDNIRSASAADAAALVGFADGRMMLVADGGNDGSGNGITAAAIRLSETFTGTAGDDTLNGSSLPNTINGGEGADVLRGQGGNDAISGDDSFTVGGADTLSGGDGNDGLSGMAGDDVIFGGTGNDTLLGGNGNDVLYGDAGVDSMEGGAGDDTYVVDATGDVVRELANEGTDTAWVSATSWVVPFNVEIARLFGAGTTLTTAFEGNPGGSIIPRIYVANASLASNMTGGQGADELWGGNAGDTLLGGNGDDTLRGQGGTDSMLGGFGNDAFVVDDATDIVVESTGAGADTAWVTTTGWTMAANVETGRLLADNAVLTGNGADDVLVTNGTNSTLIGGEGNDALWGGALAQRLQGGLGDDVFRGGGGADTLVGGEGSDIYVLVSGTETIIEDEVPELILFLNTDTAWYGVSGATMASHVEIGRLFGAAASLTGSAQANELVGNAAVANTLLGGAGNDTLWGSAQADHLTGGTGDDVLYSYGGADRFIFDAADWGFDQVSGFDRGAGAKFDMRGSGLTFQDLVFTSADGNTQFASTQARTLVYGATSLEASDFIF